MTNGTGVCWHCKQTVAVYALDGGFTRCADHMNRSGSKCFGANSTPEFKTGPTFDIPVSPEKSEVRVTLPVGFSYTLFLGAYGGFLLRYITGEGVQVTTGPQEETFRKAVNRLIVFHRQRFYGKPDGVDFFCG